MEDRPKVNIECSDSYFLWYGEDNRESKNDWSNEKIKEFYGINSPKWKNLVNETKIQKKVIFIGMNPNRNNEKIIEGTRLAIQVFHSSSHQDLFLKKLYENHKSI